jgi:hypothetical protein
MISLLCAQDVYNRFAPPAEVRALDASNAVEFLSSMHQTHGVHVKHSVDADGRLDRVFMEMPRAAEKWAQGASPDATSSRSSQVLLFDTTVSNVVKYS